jgi:plastocyanin domain-containing protein
MSQIQIVVILSGIVLTVLIAWYFWFAPKAQTRLNVGASGAQEAAIIVKGGYTPDVIVVQKGRPVRLTFTRQESSACSEKVLFPDFNQNALLPEGEQVTLEFTPEKAGEYGFQCQMGMLRGKLIVEEG